MNRLPVLALAAWAGAALGWGATTWSWLTVVAAMASVFWLVPGASVLRARHGRAVLAAAVVVLVAGIAGSLGRAAATLPPEFDGRAPLMTAEVVGEERQIAATDPADRRMSLELRIRRMVVGEFAADTDMPAHVFTDRTPLWAAVPPGAIVDFRGRPEPPDRLGSTVAVTALAEPTRVAAPSGVTAWCNDVRSGLRERLADGPIDARTLVSGLTAGDESEQSPDFARAMAVAGLAHLTAVSGGNISIVVVSLVGLARIARLPVTAQIAVAGLGLACYVALVGPQPSVIRAAAMGACGLFGVLLGGLRRGLPVLSSCVLVLLLLSPRLAVTIGFALSVAATLAMLWLAPRLLQVMGDLPVTRRLPGGLRLVLAVAVAAQSATLPLLLLIGAPLSVLAVPANVLVAPLVGPITVLGLAVALLPAIPFLIAMADVLARVALTLSGAIVVVARTADGWSTSPLVTVAALLLVVVTSVGWGPVLARRWTPALNRLIRSARRLPKPLGRGNRWWFRLLGAVVAVVGLLAAIRAPWHRSWVPDNWIAVVCDVGQGTAVLIHDEGDSAVLVDTGPPQGDVARCLDDAGVRRLRAVVLTHEHVDHIGGLGAVAGEVPIGELLIDPFDLPAENATSVRATASERGLAVADLPMGSTLVLGGVTGSVLWPPASFTGSEEQANNSSVVIRWVWRDGHTLLTTGDVEPESQARLLSAGVDLAAEAVLIPHHGSSHQDPRFAMATHPAVALASLGADNDYGHPSGATLLAYEAQRARTYRTDQAGSVALAPGPDGGLTIARQR